MAMTIPNAGEGLISVELIAAVRRGDGRVMATLLNQCKRYVKRWHWLNLSDDDCDEIVLGALCEAFGDPKLGDGELAEGLIRALEKHKKRMQRAQFRATTELDEVAAPVIPSHEEGAIICDQTRQALNEVFEAMACELPLLTVRGHDLIIRYYGLQSWYSPKAPPVDFLSPAAKRKTVYRTRRRFSYALEARLGKRLEEANADELGPITLALEIVRGERYLEAATLLGELKLGG